MMHTWKTYLTASGFVFLVGLYPVFALLGYNISEVNIQVVFRPLLLSLLFTMIVGAVAFLCARDAAKAALLSGAVLILFFSYGHVYFLLNGFKVFNIVIGRQSYLALFYVVLMAGIAYGILSRKKSPVGLLRIMNVMAVVLIAFPIFQIGSYLVRDYLSERQALKSGGLAVSAQAPVAITQNLPDIYYIILDMYPRNDILKQEIGYDNSAFLNDLKEMGFYIADCSLSNYGQTQLSLASSLNMNYLTELGDFPGDSTDRTMLDNLIENNAVRTSLEAKGYKTVSLSAFQPLKIESAAVSFSTDSKDISADLDASTISPFEAMFINSTALRAFTGLPQLSKLEAVWMINYPYTEHIIQQRYILKTLREIPNIPGPKFVFVHIQIPHPPLVFGPEGQIVENPPPFPSNPANPIPKEQGYKLFGDQVAFIDKKMIEILPAILNHPGQRPIVILQGDHGPDASIRTAVLNAYYLPDETQAFLYSNISPVNSFRLVLDRVFGMNMGLVKDASFNSSYVLPFLYEEVKNTPGGCNAAP